MAPAAPNRRAASRSLKLCFISETLHAGVGRHLTDIVCALAERGHEIHLLYSPIRLDLQCLTAIRQQPNVRCEAVPMPREIGLRDVAAFARIRNYVRAAGPFDVIHGHSAKGGGYARLLGLFGHSTVVYTPHAFITQSPALGAARRAAYGAIESGLGQATDRVICLSKIECDHARSLGIAARRLAVIGHGIAAVPTPPRETIRRNLGLEDDQVAIAFVGRMDAQKAPERLVAAAKLFLPQMPKIALMMVGDGPKRPALTVAMQKAGLGERVTWLGAVNARQCMPAFDALAVPSLYEGFAYVLIEALHAGLPIVTTPVGGSHETVEHGANGFIVPHGDDGEMAAAIRRLAEDAPLRRAMGEASRERAQHFSIMGMVDATEQLYQDLIAAKAEPAAAPLPQPPQSAALETDPEAV